MYVHVKKAKQFDYLDKFSKQTAKLDGKDLENVQGSTKDQEVSPGRPDECAKTSNRHTLLINKIG